MSLRLHDILHQASRARRDVPFSCACVNEPDSTHIVKPTRSPAPRDGDMPYSCSSSSHRQHSLAHSRGSCGAPSQKYPLSLSLSPSQKGERNPGMYPPPARRTVIEDESINISRDSSSSCSSCSFSSFSSFSSSVLLSPCGLCGVDGCRRRSY